jgi:hypothetical protein
MDGAVVSVSRSGFAAGGEDSDRPKDGVKT